MSEKIFEQNENCKLFIQELTNKLINKLIKM